MKRKIEKCAEECLSAYENNEFLEQLKSRIPEKKKSGHPISLYAICSGVLSVVIITISLLTVFLMDTPSKDTIDNGQNNTTNNITDNTDTLNDNVDLNKPYYSASNIVGNLTSLEDFYSAVDGVVLNESDLDSVVRFNCSETGDLLYYSVTWETEDMLTSLMVKFYVNDNYDPLLEIYDEEMEILGKPFKYSINLDKLEEDVTYFFYEGNGYGYIGEMLIEVDDYFTVTFEEGDGMKEMLEEKITLK